MKQETMKTTEIYFNQSCTDAINSFFTISLLISIVLLFVLLGYSLTKIDSLTEEQKEHWKNFPHLKTVTKLFFMVITCCIIKIIIPIKSEPFFIINQQVNQQVLDKKDTLVFNGDTTIRIITYKQDTNFISKHK